MTPKMMFASWIMPVAKALSWSVFTAAAHTTLYSGLRESKHLLSEDASTAVPGPQAYGDTSSPEALMPEAAGSLDPPREGDTPSGAPVGSLGA